MSRRDLELLLTFAACGAFALAGDWAFALEPRRWQDVALGSGCWLMALAVWVVVFRDRDGS